MLDPLSLLPSRPFQVDVCHNPPFKSAFADVSGVLFDLLERIIQILSLVSKPQFVYATYAPGSTTVLNVLCTQSCIDVRLDPFIMFLYHIPLIEYLTDRASMVAWSCWYQYIQFHELEYTCNTPSLVKSYCKVNSNTTLMEVKTPLTIPYTILSLLSEVLYPEIDDLAG